jgi:tRNA(fMet)-specific endonuclease VapC
MSPKIIADTSIWIEYFRGNPQIADFLDEHLVNNKIYINGIIIAELIQGIKRKKESEAVRASIDAVPYIEMTYNDWVFAGDLSNELRKKGLTIPLTDIATGAVAINNNMSVVTLDRHFDHIPGLKLWPLFAM